jgi:hypothetical protein
MGSEEGSPRRLSPADRLARQHAREVRERVIALLSEGFAQDLLDVDEFERRVTAAHKNDTPEAIEALAADLPARAGALAATAPAPTALVSSAPSTGPLAADEQQRLFAVMAGVDRRGDWTLPRKLKLTTLLGGAFLDLREARFPPGPVDIEIFSFMGGTQIIVPPGLAVQTHGSALMGGFQQVNRAPTNPDPDAPLLRVHGFVIMGGVDVQTWLPGENERDAQGRQIRAARDDRRRRKPRLTSADHDPEA